MNDIKLTRKGRELLLQANTSAGSEINWIGYFGLAYVPDQSNFNPDSSTLIDASEKGDYIYNIWQGDLFSEGHMIDSGRALTLYDRNISSNFKYVYNREKGCNQLVTWTCDGDTDGSTGEETPTYIRTGFKVYEGVKMGDGNNVGNVTDSEIPCPAPLVYLGKNKSYTSPVTGWESLTEIIGNDWPMDANGHPMVTPDMRFYDGNVELVNDTDFDAQPDGTVDPFGVIASPNTRSEYTLNQFGEFVSVSNFNKGHGHVSSEGYGMYTQDSCHNMSQVTRLFPIAKYEIESTQPSKNDSNPKTDEATTIKYHIELNVDDAYAAEQEYEKSLQYQAPQSSDTVSEEEQADEEIFVGHHSNSFKFNRIGIYAVRATLRHFVRESDGGNKCSDSLYQVEISPDTPPVLFAVINVDEQYIVEGVTGSYTRDFSLKLLDGEGDSICKNPEVYYNLVENEALTWYQNQLLATAGLSEAIVGLGVNVAHLMNREGGLNSQCPSGSSSLDGTEYAPKGHTHDYMRNLVDGKVNSGAVRGVDTLPEGDGTTVGEDSLILGKNTAGAGQRLLVQGEDTILDDSCADSAAIGNTRLSGSNVHRSLLLGMIPASRQDGSDETMTIECENVIGSTVSGNFDAVKNIKNSLVYGYGVSKVSVGSANDIDANDIIATDTAETVDTIAMLDGSETTPGTMKSLLIGDNVRFPFATNGSLIVSTDSNYANFDTLMDADEFNSKVVDGTIFANGSGWYVIRTVDGGTNTVKVYDETAQAFIDVPLEEASGPDSTHYNAGVYVDATTLKVSYTPYYVRNNIPVPGISSAASPELAFRTLTQGKMSQYRANPGKMNQSIFMGEGNHFADNMSNSLLIGDENDFSRFELTDCVFMGDRLIHHDDNQVNTLGVDWDGETVKYVSHRLDNVKVWATLGENVLKGLSIINDEFATSHYSDAMIFLDDRYNTPETIGIFPTPTKYKLVDNTNVVIDRSNSFFYIDPSRFTVGTNHYYGPVLGTHDTGAADYDSYDNNELFRSCTREEVAAKINKPKVPMIYTGGIGLAGYPNGTKSDWGVRAGEDNSGFIKLGSGVVPCAYIDAHPVSNWNGASSDTFIPISVSGTTISPYAGMALCIGNKQEPDGTLHLELYRRLGEAPNIFTTQYQANLPTPSFTNIRGNGKLSLCDMIDKAHMTPVLEFGVHPTSNNRRHHAHMVLDTTVGSARILSFKVEMNASEDTDVPSNRIDVTIEGVTETAAFNTTHPFD